MKKTLPFILSLLIFSFYSCSNADESEGAEILKEVPPALEPVIEGMFGDFLVPADTVVLSDFIAQKLAWTESEIPISINGQTLFDFEEVSSAYASRQFKALWIVSELADSVFAELAEIENDGLLSSDYLLLQINNLREQLEKSDEKDLSKWAELDILMTNAMLKYGKHLLEGKLDPTSLDEFWNFTKRESPQALGKLLATAHDSADLKLFFKAVRPQNHLYLNMRKSLQTYKLHVDSGGWNRVVWTSKKSKLEPGDTNAIVPDLRSRLALEFFLDSANYATDSVYDTTLQGAIAKFQVAHGLYPDSIVGKSTISLLNISAQEKVDAILVNLERLRWSIGNLGGNYILVNAAEYRLWFFQEDTVTWQTEVIIGAPYTATPFFMSELQSVVFNPTWTLPYSIASKEMLPKLRADAGCLAKQNMILMDREGKTIDPSSVDFNKVSRSKFPYIIRQQPGKTNSLGVVKFVMPNTYSIYLHDTPSKALFKREERAFSHGCIRVNKPLTLAEKVLVKNENWYSDSIQSILNTGQTTQIRLDTSIPVLLLYITHYTNVHGQAYFFKDVYGMDKKVADALKR